MQEGKTLVPSFGTWDADTEIPFTTVFEKVRATKDGKPLRANGVQLSYETPTKHQFQGNSSPIYPQYESGKYIDPSSELHHGKMAVPNKWDINAKRETDLQSFLSRKSSLEQIADHIFTESQHAARNKTPVVTRQSTVLKTLWRENEYVSNTELRELYGVDNVCLQPAPDGLNNCLHHGSSFDGHNQGHQAYGSRVPRQAALSRKEHGLPRDSVGSHPLMYSPGTPKCHQQLKTNNRSGEMPPDRILPKFGDWDALDPTKVEFTVIFDKARNERKGTLLSAEYSLSTNINPDTNEDLYKPTSTRRNGFVSWICCGPPSS